MGSPEEPAGAPRAAPSLPLVSPSALRRAASEWARVPEPVAEEEAHLESAYSKLERLDLLPDFLSLNDVVALHPEPEVREQLRERVRAQLRGEDAEVLLGAHFDEQGRWFLLWLRDEALTQVAAVYDRGRRTHRQVFFRGFPSLRDVLSTRAERAAGLDIPELVVQRITSPSLCCLPVDFEVYRLTPWGSLANVLTFPKNHHEVGPGVRWTFVNHFDFAPDQRAHVRRIFPEPEPDAAPAEGPWEFTFVEAAGRYLPTPETAARLRREQQERAERDGLE